MENGPSNEWLRKLPKIDLHVHLDGSLRPMTIWEILERDGKNSFSSPAELEKRVRVPDDISHLSAYLDCFEFLLRHLQKPEDIERAAFELAEDSFAENIRYLEIRFSPILHLKQSATIEEIIEAALKGLARAESNFPIKTGLIVCCIREQNPESSVRLAQAAAKYREEGLVGIDLAGDEYNFPATLHRKAFDISREAGLNRTVHSGEVKNASSIREALEVLNAQRIGHGLHLRSDPGLFREFVVRKIPLEMCLTTNVHTKAVAGFDQHPAGEYLKSGVRVTLNTDDRLMSNTTLTKELEIARDQLSLQTEDFITLTENALEAAFLAKEEKQRLKDHFSLELSILKAEFNPPGHGN